MEIKMAVSMMEELSKKMAIQIDKDILAQLVNQKI